MALPFRKASNFDVNGLTSFDFSKASSDCPQLSKTLFARTRSCGFSLTGAVSVPNTAAPPGVAQISSVLGGNFMLSESLPHTCSKRGRYSARDNRNAMHAVSGNPISCVSTGGCCACSASGFCSKYPVERESQKFPPKNRPCVSLSWNTGNQGAYEYRCAVRLPARK